jgi:hypothetical protein
MADETPFEEGPKNLVVMGQPNKQSTTICTGDDTKTQLLRKGETGACYITVLDDGGNGGAATTGFPSDFGTPGIVKGSFTANSMVSSDGAESSGKMKFTIAATGNVGEKVIVTPKVTNALGNVENMPTEDLIIIGTPTTKTTFACAGAGGDTNIRESETVTCLITVKDANGQTSGLVGDFTVASSAGFTEISNIAEATGDLTSVMEGTAKSYFQFTMTAPAVRGTTANVKLQLVGTNGNSDLDAGTTITFVVLGQPTSSSTLACTGGTAGGGTGHARIGQTDVLCTITLKDANGVATTGQKGDFKAPTTVGSQAVGALTDVSGGATVTFTMTAPAAAGATFSATGKMSDDDLFNQGPYSLVVVGKPQAQSTLVCAGATTKSQVIRLTELFNCQITARKGDAAITTALATDFPTSNLASDKCLVNTDNAGVAESSGATAGEIFVFQGGKCNDASVNNGNTAVGDTVSITAKVLVNNVATALAADEKLTIIGTPTKASLIQCVGDTTESALADKVLVRESETVVCTITVKDGNGGTTGLTPDFVTGTINGGTQVSSISDDGDNNGDTNGGTSTSTASVFKFTLTAPVLHTTAFNIKTTLKDTNQVLDHDGNGATTGGTGKEIINFEVIGTPSTKSTLACQGAAGAGNPVRKGETVTCTITCKNAADAATKCLAGDFSDISTVGGGTKGTMTSVTSDFKTVTQTIVAPSTAGASFQNTGVLADGDANFQEGAVSFIVVGQPTTRSTITCLGKTYGLVSVRIDETVQCFIHVRDASGVTTGFPADFGAPNVVKGTYVTSSGIKEQSGGKSGSTMVFDVTPVAGTALGSTIDITGKVGTSGFVDANGAANVYKGIKIIGTPTAKSIIVCVGDDSGTLEVRTGEVVTCTITSRSDTAAVTALAVDFISGTIVGGTAVTAVASATNLETHTFKVTAPTTAGADFSIVSKLSATGNAVLDHDTNGATNGGTGGAKIEFVVAGRPDSTSTLSCVGPQSDTKKLRAGDTATCTITPKTNGVDTTGSAADFAQAITEGSNPSSPAVPTNGDGSSLTFTVTAPSTAGALFTITARVKINNVNVKFAAGAYTMTLIGTPGTESTMVCNGESTPGSFVRHATNEKAKCVISIKATINGVVKGTTGFASDFGTPTVVGGSAGSISAQASDTEMTFLVTRTADIGATFSVRGKLSSTGTPNIDAAASAVEIVGTPTDASTIACVGQELSATDIVRTTEIVDCTLTCHDANGKTTCLVADFGNPLLVGGTGASSFIRVAKTADNAPYTDLTFTVNSPSAIGTNTFTIQIKLADNTEVGTHSFPTVVGRPTIASEIDCAGAAGAGKPVRKGETVTCTIDIKDS